VRDPDRWLAPAGAVAIVFAAFALYWPYLDDFFALDDFIWLQSATNGDVADYLRGAFSFPTGSAVDVPTPFWRPLVDVYFFAAWRLFGDEPWPYHAVNVALHAGVALLLAVLVRQLSSSWGAGIAAGLVFVVLPAYQYAVVWISSVTELFGAFFYLLTLVLYAAHLRAPNRALYAISIAALFLTLLSKESGVTLPVALGGVALVRAPPRDRGEARALVHELLPFVALTLAYFVFLYIEEYDNASEGSLYSFGWHARENLWDYLQWLVLPVPNSSAEWVADARPYAAAAFLAVGGATLLLRRWAAAFAFGWALLALIPYSFFEAGIELRYTYLACAPFAAFVALVARDALALVAAAAGPRVAFAIGAAAAVVCAALLAAQVGRGQEVIAEQAVAYRDLYEQSYELCGDLPPEATVFILYSPISDLFGASAGMALNVRYEDVGVARSASGELPELFAFIEHKCAIRYADASGRYIRVD
jgi:hypothetical protein